MDISAVVVLRTNVIYLECAAYRSQHLCLTAAAAAEANHFGERKKRPRGCRRFRAAAHLLPLLLMLMLPLLVCAVVRKLGKVARSTHQHQQRRKRLRLRNRGIVIVVAVGASCSRETRVLQAHACLHARLSESSRGPEMNSLKGEQAVVVAAAAAIAIATNKRLMNEPH